MKKHILTISIFFCFWSLVAQNTAYFKVANHGTIEKIEKVSSGGFITVGYDSVYKLQVIKWDNNYNLQWKFIRFTSLFRIY